MKKCPSCEKTYEDSMRFCQIDGTPLVDDAPPVDPYKTIVASPSSFAAAPPAEPAAEAAPPAAPVETPVEAAPPAAPVETAPPASPVEAAIPTPPVEAAATPIHEPEEVLEVPANDPLKTMYVSEDEMRQALSSVSEPEEPIMEIPAISEATPEPPKFIEPEMPAPSFTAAAPPSTPFADQAPSVPEPVEEPAAAETSPAEAFDASIPPIPSPFDAAPPAAASESVAPSEPTPPAFLEPETVIQPFPPASPFADAEPPAPTPEPVFTPTPAFTPTPEPAITPENELPPFKEPEPFQPVVGSPFQQQEQSPAAWTPPPAPDASWQNQEIGQNTPFQPPPAGGVNQTMPIICLVLGILSVCCYVSPVTGLAALITGYLSMKNIKNDPANYGGRGLAIAGMVVGGIFFLLGLAYWIYIIFVVGFVALGSFAR